MIWEKPWLLCEGFLIGVGLIIMGLMLQLSIGPIDWSLFAWPVNIMVLAALLLIVVGIFMLRRKVYAFQFLGTYGAAVPALVCAAVLTVIMGLTRQEAVGTWLHNMLTFWPFVLLYTYIVLILGLVILKQARMVVANCSLYAWLRHLARPRTLNSQFSILNSQSSILNSQSSPISACSLPLPRRRWAMLICSVCRCGQQTTPRWPICSRKQRLSTNMSTSPWTRMGAK